MARPTARVLALLEILQTGGTRTVSELASRLGVDERTVRRYVTHLIDLDIPVRAIRGRYGGYRLAPGFRMPPLMLTDDEALAVMLGLLAATRAGSVTVPAAAVHSATAKVQRVLPEATGRRLAALVETSEVTAPRRAATPTDSEILLQVAEAARNRRPIAVAYVDRAGATSERTVLPYGLVAHGGRWYLTGHDSRSGEIRSLRLDRVSSLTVQPGEFEVPPGFDPVDSVLAGLARTPWRHVVAVRVEDDPTRLRQRLPPGLADVSDLGDGWVRLRLRAQRLDWVPALLVGLDRPFVVEEPDELRDRVRALARRVSGWTEAS